MRFSVVIASYNRIGTLGRAIASAKSQSLPPLEIIVVDDGSQDGSPDWVRSAYPDVRLLAQPKNGGAAHARNLGIAAAHGEAVAFLDSDDWWEPQHLQGLATAWEGRGDAVMAVSDAWMLLENQGPPHPQFVQACRPNPAYASLTENLLLENFVTTMSCVAVRLEAARAAGPLRPELRVVHDLEWYLRLAQRGGVVSTEKATAWRRIGADSLVNQLPRFVADQRRFFDDFFQSPLGASLRHLQWQARSRAAEGFGAMAMDGGQPWRALVYRIQALLYAARGGAIRRDLLRLLRGNLRQALGQWARAVGLRRPL